MVWFKTPEDTLINVPHFVDHVLNYGTHEDVKILRKYLNDNELREILTIVPPGIIDMRSWCYWTIMLDVEGLEYPKRKFD